MLLLFKTPNPAEFVKNYLKTLCCILNTKFSAKNHFIIYQLFFVQAIRITVFRITSFIFVRAAFQEAVFPVFRPQQKIFHLTELIRFNC